MGTVWRARTHVNLSVGRASSGGCHSTVRVVAVLAFSTRLCGAEDTPATALPLWAPDVTLTVSTDDGRDVPSSFIDITKKLYILPCFRSDTVATVSVRLMVCRRKYHVILCLW